MLKSFTIEGFKSLGKPITVELGQVNVFIGANGSGKTNVLESLATLACSVSKRYSGQIDDKALKDKGVRPSPKEHYMSSFRGPAISNSINSENLIRFQATWKKQGKVVYECKLNPETKEKGGKWHYIEEVLTTDDIEDIERNVKGVFVYGRANEKGEKNVVHFKIHLEPYSGFIASNLGEEIRIPVSDNELLLYNGLVPADDIQSTSNFLIYSPSSSILRDEIEDPDQNDPVGLHGGRLANAVEDLIDADENKFGSLRASQVLNFLDWVEDFHTTEPSRHLLASNVPARRTIISFNDRFMVQGKDAISAYNASEGALYVLFLLVLALHPDTPPVFSVDNFDQAMNPRLVMRLTELFCEVMLKSEKQALITTHNPAVLDGLDITEDNIRLFAVDRDREGSTVVNRIEVDDKFFKTKKDKMPLSQMWMNGMLGGVPTI
jgi:AAA15 family ATPase/GTPase